MGMDVPRTTKEDKNTNTVELDSVNVALLNKHLVLTSSSSSAAAGQIISTVERLLASINDMMEARLRSDDQLRDQRDKDQQMMSEWMIAAAVIDRICFIVFSLCFLVCSAVFCYLATFA